MPILDPQFLLSLPKDLAAHTQIHLFTHAIQSYLSLMASHYTTPLTLQPINLTFHYLKSSLQQNHKHSPQKIHN
uniref:iron-containing alcohol dehydrogenase n=1 Tax=Staphylococcus epidermidis TaxID=1282 RepID=UPI0021B20E73